MKKYLWSWCFSKILHTEYCTQLPNMNTYHLSLQPDHCVSLKAKPTGLNSDTITKLIIQFNNKKQWRRTWFYSSSDLFVPLIFGSALAPTMRIFYRNSMKLNTFGTSDATCKHSWHSNYRISRANEYVNRRTLKNWSTQHLLWLYFMTNYATICRPYFISSKFECQLHGWNDTLQYSMMSLSSWINHLPRLVKVHKGIRISR